jgi:alpha-beta hydrolase superfamily lysophospholipase
VGDLGTGGFDLLVEDMVRLSQIAHERDPGLPFVLLGHSMGSFAAQQYVLEHSAMTDGLVLSGSGALEGLARLASSGARGVNVLNAPFEPARTPFDWLSRDPDVVDALIGDPLCFAALQPATLASFLSAAPRVSDAGRLQRVRKELPIYLFSGSEDPVGQQLEGLMVLIERYRRAGVDDISYDFYDGGRHEMLNETNRHEVLEHLLSWIDVVVDRPEPSSNGPLISKPRHCSSRGRDRSDRYSSKWALGLIGAALLLVILVGMIRDITERWSRRKERRLDGG